MFPRLVGIVAALLLAILVIDLFAVRGRVRQNPIARPWDVAPIIGFLGAVLLALAFVEATRREVVDAWRWGIAFGFLLSVGAGIGMAMMYHPNRQMAQDQSKLRTLWRLAQAYGITLLFGILGVVIAVRVIGAVLEVFLASALGVLVIATAVAVFVIAWRRKSVSVK